jgi:CRISPR/Cas system CSM-associated protein Csm3 (group 7 of RAMP superfamily)
MKKTYEINVKLLSALHINSGVSSDGRRLFVTCGGKPYIPATLIKGITRDNFTKLLKTFSNEYSVDNCDYEVEKIFGKEGFQKSRIIFDNLYTKNETIVDTRANISINRYTRKVNHGALVFSKVVSPFDNKHDNICFNGEFALYFNDDKYISLLIKSIEMIKCLGSGKSRGLGFVEVMVSEKKS